MSSGSVSGEETGEIGDLSMTSLMKTVDHNDIDHMLMIILMMMTYMMMNVETFSKTENKDDLLVISQRDLHSLWRFGAKASSPHLSRKASTSLLRLLSPT